MPFLILILLIYVIVMVLKVHSFNPIENSIISDADIQRLYDVLYPYSRVGEETKQKHIQNIKDNHDKQFKARRVVKN